jgi:hypothetical protein
MIRSKLLLCAEGITRDAESNNISVFNIYEELTPPSLPIIVPKMSILSVVERDQNDPNLFPATLRISLANQIVFEQQIEFNFQGLIRTRNIIVFGGMPITQPGTMDIVILINNDVFQTYQIRVNTPQVPLPQAPLP